jgi:hypothetical protein
MAPFPIFSLPEGLLDRVVGCLDLWDLAAARAACPALRAAAGRRARRLSFSPWTLQRERGEDEYVQVGSMTWPRRGAPLYEPRGRDAVERRGPRRAARGPARPRPPVRRRPASERLSGRAIRDPLVRDIRDPLVRGIRDPPRLPLPSK